MTGHYLKKFWHSFYPLLDPLLGRQECQSTMQWMHKTTWSRCLMRFRHSGILQDVLVASGDLTFNCSGRDHVSKDFRTSMPRGNLWSKQCWKVLDSIGFVRLLICCYVCFGRPLNLSEKVSSLQSSNSSFSS